MAYARSIADVPSRLADMDANGIEHQLISATPILFVWDRPADAALDAARHFNDAALEMCAESGGRLHALCQVPLQDVDASCVELERAMTSGHRGVHIGNHVGCRDLDDAGLLAFLQHAADLGAPVLVHPWDMDPLAGRLDKASPALARAPSTRQPPGPTPSAPSAPLPSPPPLASSRPAST